MNASVNGYGIRPIQAGPLHETLAAHLRGYVAFEQHVVKAALSGRRDDALRAFLLDPNMQARLDLEQTEQAAGRAAGGKRPVAAAVRGGARVTDRLR